MSACQKIALFFTILISIGFWVCAIGYGGLLILAQYSPLHYSNCEEYTKRLNGGTHEFTGEKLSVARARIDDSVADIFMRKPQKKKLNIALCGLGGGRDDLVRLQVRSLDGELLAERFFTVNWESGWNYALEYHEDSLDYYDGEGSKDIGAKKETLSMPPTAIDWIRARLP